MRKIEHIGIAVKNLQESNLLFEKLFGTPPYKEEEVESEGVKTSFFMNGPNKIELLEATNPNSPIAKFLEKKGEGIHHIAFDVKGNQSSIKFTLKIAAGEMSNEDVLFTTKNQLHPQEEYTYSSESAQLEFPKKSVYEPIELNWAKLDYSILSPSTPVNVPFTIKCKVKGELDGKHYFEVATGGSNRALEIKYEDNWAVAESKYYGPYSLKRDETGPTVYPVNFTNSTTFISKSTLVWKITDRGIGIKDYDLFIDDQWHLLEYESKGDYITFSIPANFSGTKNIRIIAADACGNETKWEKEVTFK